MPEKAPPELLAAARARDTLPPWERAELGRALRRLGWTYGEIRRLIPVAKGTLSGWCRDIRLSPEHVAAIQRRTGSRRGVPRDTQRKRRAEAERLRVDAVVRVPELIASPEWVAGVMLYWAEGSKTSRTLEMTNSDERLLRRFISWVRAYHDPRAEFVLMLHLHHGNDDAAARDRWRAELDLPGASFHRTYVKPPGTGHRKNRLPHGVCRVRMRRSADAWIVTMAWIEQLSTVLERRPPGAC